MLGGLRVRARKIDLCDCSRSSYSHTPFLSRNWNWQCYTMLYAIRNWPVWWRCYTQFEIGRSGGFPVRPKSVQCSAAPATPQQSSASLFVSGYAYVICCGLRLLEACLRLHNCFVQDFGARYVVMFFWWRPVFFSLSTSPKLVLWWIWHRPLALQSVPMMRGGSRGRSHRKV